MTRTLLVLFAILTMGCDEETIVAASDDKPEKDAGVDAGALDCDDNDDCQSDEYCEKDGCGDRRGRCTLRPAGCGGEDMRVCGCDGVTYFNDCLRRQNGMGLRAPQECIQDPLRCGGPSNVPCPDGAECALIVRGRPPPVCSDDPPGVCWALPTTCDSRPMGGGDRYTPCGGPPACLDLCSAIRTRELMLRVDRCMP